MRVKIARTFILSVLLIATVSVIHGQWNQFDTNGPRGSIAFGTQVVVLSNGNYFVSDPGFDLGAGAVFLYDGQTHRVISQLMGSNPGDKVGSGGLYEIGNDRIVVSSPEWRSEAGAATWMENRAGFFSRVDARNSLVGRIPGSRVSDYGIFMLSSRNYVVFSPNWTDSTSRNQMGAVTWGDHNGSTVGVVSASNSIVGSQSNDYVGGGFIRFLRNGNYVIRSQNWANRGATMAGAVTWCNGRGGTVGRVSPANSLVGTQSGDRVGWIITPLTNSNYVVGSPYFQLGAIPGVGAVTLGDGANGTSGPVNSSNSLLGASADDRVGERVVALSNGHYVSSTQYWDDPATGATDVGAVTWGKGTGGITGTASSSNSFIGTNKNDRVGSGAIVALNNGNYVFASPFWYKERGAVTWGDGGGGNSHGRVWDTNSLVGKVGKDHVGGGGLTPLSNGNYVVSSPEWDLSNNGYVLKKDVGAATWGDGVSGSVGYVDSTNSITGSSDGDSVSNSGITGLRNGNYVIASSLWDWNGDPDVGAVTLATGAGPIADVVSPTNSLKGIYKGDRVGHGGVVELVNNNYAVSSPYWSSFGNDPDGVGAVTWGDGQNGTTGDVTSSNSLTGAASGDRVSLGLQSAFPNAVRNGGFSQRLFDGNMVISSPLWGSRGVNADGIGAVTWFDATRPITGVVDASNSLVGNTRGDSVGYAGPSGYRSVEPLQNGYYAVYSPFWDNGGIADAGAVTLAKTGGITGRITRWNSVLGSVQGQPTYGGVLVPYLWLSPTNHLFVGLPFENKVSIIGP